MRPIEWTSSDPEIATVDGNGLVTLVGVGETQIIATFAGNDEYLDDKAEYHLLVMGTKYKKTGEGTAAVSYSNQPGKVTIKKTTVIDGITYNVTSIAEKAFKDNKGITSVTIPEGVTSINDYAFYGCINLHEINIGKDVNLIGKNAFAYVGTASMTRTRGEENSINIDCFAEDVPQTAEDAFESTDIAKATLHVPENLVEQYKVSAPWSGFGTIVGVSGTGITEISKDAQDGVIYNLNGNRLKVMSKGINLIRQKDGRVIKVLKK